MGAEIQTCTLQEEDVASAQWKASREITGAAAIKKKKRMTLTPCSTADPQEYIHRNIHRNPSITGLLVTCWQENNHWPGCCWATGCVGRLEQDAREKRLCVWRTAQRKSSRKSITAGFSG